jgi:hypothetical protein
LYFFVFLRSDQPSNFIKFIVVGTELVTWRGRTMGLVRACPASSSGRGRWTHCGRCSTVSCQRPVIGGHKLPIHEAVQGGVHRARVTESKPMPREDLPRPVVFHNERFMQKPSPALTLLTVLWISIGLVLTFLRIVVGALLPMNMVYHTFHALSVRVTIRGNSPPPTNRETGQIGMHRTLCGEARAGARGVQCSIVATNVH